MMVMLGVSYKSITSKMHLDWASKRQNALDIYVVRIILDLCFNVLLHVMKLVKVAIIPSYR